ncbi:HAD hydrolase family protein [Streptomyces sp. NPDC051920]|uniref:HAD hydrolase family protein n=1 Tax=Streptomyces sp. NPDC051920 TaxID=3155523 RepID=UPI00341E9E9E
MSNTNARSGVATSQQPAPGGARPSIPAERAARRGRRTRMTVRLVCTDLDGTLLDSSGAIRERTLSTLAEAERAGIAVVGVTGRPVRDTLDLARRHGLTGPVVCSNGAVTVDVRSGRLLDCRGFGPGDAAGILRAVRDAVPGVALGVDSVSGLRLETAFVRLVPNAWRHVMLDGVSAPADADPVVKILAAHPMLLVDELAAVIASVVGERAVITRSTGDFLEMSAPGVDKGQALRTLAERSGIPAEHTAAVGDMPNDIPMLRAAGLAAAVANAHEDTLRAADIVLPSNDDEGVAALVRLVLPRAAAVEACRI